MAFATAFLCHWTSNFNVFERIRTLVSFTFKSRPHSEDKAPLRNHQHFGELTAFSWDAFHLAKLSGSTGWNANGKRGSGGNFPEQTDNLRSCSTFFVATDRNGNMPFHLHDGEIFPAISNVLWAGAHWLGSLPFYSLSPPSGGALGPQGSPPPRAEHLVPRAQWKKNIDKLTFLLTFCSLSCSFFLLLVICCVLTTFFL